MTNKRIKHHQREFRYYSNLFRRAETEKKTVRIGEFCISIDNMQIEPGGCAQCGAAYDDIELHGILQDINLSASYTATVKSWYIMCMCDDNFTDDDIPLLFFDGVVDSNLLYRRFLARESVHLEI
jgi:hypothetical protein